MRPSAGAVPDAVGGWVSRVGVAVGVMCLGATSALAAAPPVVGARPRSGVVATGNDISFPQCGAAFPTGQAFGIVGVNDGLANSLNPCLGPPASAPTLAGSELDWAASTSVGAAGQPGASLYVNTADPGNAVQGTPIADWPTAGSTPDGVCTVAAGSRLGQDSAACAFEYGFQKAAQDALWLTAAARAINALSPPSPVPTVPGAYPFWLDVETANSWQTGGSGLAMNVADLQGMVAALRQAGVVSVGLYSTASQWGQITGGTGAALGSLAGLPEWVPGAVSQAGALADCAAAPFAAGPVVLTEWVGQPFDGDLVCPLGAPADLSATPGNGELGLSWVAPADPGGVITGYTVTGADVTTGASLAPIAVQGSPPATTAAVTGLVPGDLYSLTVTALTAGGSGPPSTPLTVKAPSPYQPVTPFRVCDTRPAATPGTPCTGRDLAGGASLTVQVAGIVPEGSAAAPVPAGAVAAVLNVTATDATATSYLTVWPAGGPRPLASNLNWTAGATIADLVTVPLSASGAIELYNRAGSVAVIVDVEGYYGPASAGTEGLGFTPVAPTRVCDTRSGAPPTTPCSGHPLTAASTRTVLVAGTVVPAGAAAAVLEVTATDTTAASYLTVWPAGEPRPLASNLNWTAGATAANRVIVSLSPAGAVDVYNAAGSMAVVVDVVGYFSVTGTGLFEPVTPVRVCDTRATAGLVTACTGRMLVGGAPLDVSMTASGAVPPSAAAVVATVTVTDATASSYLTVYPAGSARPLTSDLNWVGGQTVANLVVVGLGPNGVVSLTGAGGTADVVVDVDGWYT